jgi:predicted CoA-binding protein
MMDDHTVEACPLPGAPSDTADAAMVAVLAHARTVAVVGASPNPERTSHQIARWLMENTPFQVFLVNPVAGGEEIEGHGFYGSIAELPVVPDIVDVFRRSEFVPEVADAAIAAGSAALWLQLGVTHDAAAVKATSHGMEVIQDRCIKVEYRRLSEAIEARRGPR